MFQKFGAAHTPLVFPRSIPLLGPVCELRGMATLAAVKLYNANDTLYYPMPLENLIRLLSVPPCVRTRRAVSLWQWNAVVQPIFPPALFRFVSRRTLEEKQFSGRPLMGQ